MKSDQFEERFYVECSCGDIQQVLIFNYWKMDDDDPDSDTWCELYFSDAAKWTFFFRLWRALKYLFWKDPLVYGCILIDEKNKHQLEEVLKFLVEKMK